jgi:hypothetical protein
MIYTFKYIHIYHILGSSQINRSAKKADKKKEKIAKLSIVTVKEENLSQKER